jgi:hypothetical protein
LIDTTFTTQYNAGNGIGFQVQIEKVVNNLT